MYLTKFIEIVNLKPEQWEQKDIERYCRFVERQEKHKILSEQKIKEVSNVTYS